MLSSHYWQTDVSRRDLEAVECHAAGVSGTARGRVAGAGAIMSLLVDGCSGHSAALKRVVDALVVVLVVDVRAAVLCRRRRRAVRRTSRRPHRSRLLRLGERPARVHVTRLLHTRATPGHERI